MSKQEERAPGEGNVWNPSQEDLSVWSSAAAAGDLEALKKITRAAAYVQEFWRKRLVHRLGEDEAHSALWLQAENEGDTYGMRFWGAVAYRGAFPPHSSRYQVDPLVFNVPDGEILRFCNPSVEVRSEEFENVRDALRAAAERLILVTEDGVEHPDYDALLDSPMAAYNPSYVSDPVRTEQGVGLYIDFSPSMEPALTMVRILIEELERHGVQRAVIGPMDRDKEYPPA